MKRLSSHIVVGSYLFKGVVNLQIQSSYELLTDTCTLEIQRKTHWKGKNVYLGDSGLLNRYDNVSVQIGYNDKLYEVFKGYLKDISAGVTPVVLNCEDEMLNLKKDAITKSWKNVTLKQLLSEILPNTDIVSVDATLGQFRISNATPAQVLEELKKAYALFSFFRNGKLYVGLPYWPEYQKTHTFKFTQNIISNNLQYVKSEDVKLQVKAVSMLPDNTKIETTAGDTGGETITLHAYNLNEKELKTFAQNNLDKYRYTGYKGSFVSFGEPFTQHGDIVNIVDPDYPERNGSYLVKSVNTEFGQRFTQTIELGVKV